MVTNGTTTTTGRSTVAVSISNFAYSSISATAPLVVRWTNHDSVEHDVVGSDGVRSPMLAPGASYERRFDAPVTFTYTCSVHPFMSGTVTVR